jgi:hypothetical protein
MRKITALLLPLLLALPASAGEKKFDPEARARFLAPFLDSLTLGIIHFDVTRVDAETLSARLAEAAGWSPKELAREKALLQEALAAYARAGVKEVYIVFSLADLLNMPFALVPLEEGAKEAAVAELFDRVLGISGVHEKIGNAYFGGSKRTRERLRTFKPTPRPEVAKAFAAAGDTAVQLLFFLPEGSRRVIEEMLPTLPKEIGGGPSTTLTRGLRWAAAGADASPKLTLNLVIQSENAAAAKKLRDWIAAVFKHLGEQKEVKRFLPNFDKLAASFLPRVDGDRLTLTVEEKTLVTVVLPVIQRVRSAASRAESMNHLRQFGVALHNYHDVHKTFPPAASHGKDGKPLLSWRVQILPYLGEEKLYSEFRLNEPWDSEHNKKLIPRMPKVFHSPHSLTGPGQTVYLAPVGKDTMFSDDKGTRVADVTHGLANTIFVVEADDRHAVPWTKPQDLNYDPKQPTAGLNTFGSTGYLVLMADGSTRFLPAAIKADILRALFTRSDPVPGEIP